MFQVSKSSHGLYQHKAKQHPWLKAVLQENAKYKCNICGKASKTSKGLSNHKWKYHKPQPTTQTIVRTITLTNGNGTEGTLEVKYEQNVGGHQPPQMKYEQNVSHQQPQMKYEQNVGSHQQPQIKYEQNEGLMNGISRQEEASHRALVGM